MSLSASITPLCRSLPAVALAAALAAGPGAASADIISFEQSLTQPGTLHLTSFDPALGSLTAVRLFVDFAATATLSVDPLSGGAVAIIDILVGTSLYPGIPLLSGSVKNPFGCSPTAPTCAGSVSATDSKTLDLTDPSLLQSFVGLNDFGVNFFISTNGQFDTFSAFSKVDYTYTPGDRQVVPEPSTLALVGLAGVLTAGFGRRRRTTPAACGLTA